MRPDDSEFRLRAILPADMPTLHALAIDPVNISRWRYRGVAPSFEAFVNHFNVDVLTQFAIAPSTADTLLGHVAAYGSDLRNMHVYVAALVGRDALGLGAGDVGVEMLVDYLFKTWPFRKIYAEVPGRTKAAIEALRQNRPTALTTMFEVEGKLADHIFVDGAFDDVWIVSISRERYFASESSALPGLQR